MDALFSMMEKQYSTFSKGQRRIAEYIFNAYDDAAFMTAAKLGERVQQLGQYEPAARPRIAVQGAVEKGLLHIHGRLYP